MHKGIFNFLSVGESHTCHREIWHDRLLSGNGTQFIREALDDPDWMRLDLLPLTRVSFKQDAFSRNRRIAKDKANKIAASVRSKFWNSSSFQSNLNRLTRNSNLESLSRHLFPIISISKVSSRNLSRLNSACGKDPKRCWTLAEVSRWKFQCETHTGSHSSKESREKLSD